MEDQNGGDARFGAHPAHQGEHLVLVAQVQRTGGLVQQKELGLLHQRPPQQHLLPLAAGELVQIPHRHRLQMEPGEHVRYRRTVLLAHAPADVGPAAQHERVVHRQPGGGGFLGHEGHVLGKVPGRQGQKIHAVQHGPAGLRMQDVAKALQKGAFSRAVVAQDGHARPAGHFKGDIPQDLPPAGIGEIQMLHGDHRRFPPLKRR